MQSKKLSEPSTEELLQIAKQLALLIEDNNQNTKDCLRVLRGIQSRLVSNNKSLFRRVIDKLLNTK